ncbi:MAG: nuclease [Alphaproteobacteria bacterium HGW-Alphaproteobacteria-16]|nr:MAG: nuclease [Alphaproteobacteria bacterium HGW-Alphaproteobacteria-16]
MSLFFICALALSVDGDTLRCRDQGRVRLARIDAPELHGCPRPRRCAPGDGRASKANLARLIEGKRVTCRAVPADPRRPNGGVRDRYGRIVARCSAGGRDLGAAQLGGGFAVRWP